MHLCVRLRISALFLSTAIPALLHGQFQEPTREELQMTADPKVPGADAVYLYREETTDDALHYHSYYERIKVLTEKGKETATIRVPYEHGEFKVTDIRGRTIHPDGTVIPLTAKPADLVDVKTKNYQLNTMVFTLPSVEVGSILEYRLQLRYEDTTVSSPDWTVQQPYFVHKAHYFFNPSKSEGIVNSRGQILSRLMYAVRAGQDAKVLRDASGRYSFDAIDIPPIPNDDWMPPLNSINWNVEFYYTQYTSGSEFWQSEGKQWMKDTDHFTNPTKTLQQAAAQIVTPADSDEQKARKLYDAVMKLDNTSYSREKSQAERKSEKLKAVKTAEDVWNQKSGTDDDMALLFIALSRAAGLKVYPMQVVNRSRAIFDPNYLSLRQLDDYIAVVDIGGKEIFLDPGQKMCPFGLLHWKHALSGGLRLAAGGPVYGLTASPTFRQTAVQRVAELTMSPDLSVTGNVRFVMTGQEALYWRQATLRNDEEEIKKKFNESIRDEIPDGMSADFDHFLALDDPNANLIAFVKVSGTIGTATGKRVFMPALFFESHGRHPFVAQDKRATPIDVQYAKLESDQITLHLPEGFKVESALQPTKAEWPQHAMLSLSSEQKQDAVVVSRAIAYNFTLLDATEYPNLHDFYQKVATADQQQLVLTRVAGASGN